MRLLCICYILDTERQQIVDLTHVGGKIGLRLEHAAREGDPAYCTAAGIVLKRRGPYRLSGASRDLTASTCSDQDAYADPASFSHSIHIADAMRSSERAVPESPPATSERRSDPAE